MTRSLALFAASAILAQGCARPATEADLVRREAEFAAAVAADDVERFGSFLADEALFIAPGGAIARGREDVTRAWGELLNDPALQLTWEPAEAFLSPDGELGYTHGEWRQVRDGDAGTELVGTGRYVTIWRRERDGVWRVVLDAGTADATPRVELTF
jgi:ketosteroid isomerase-like protein